jgi:exosortase A
VVSEVARPPALPGLAEVWAALRGPAAVLLAGLAVLGFAFRAEAEAAWTVWNESTAYNHCFLVLPIALYLAWDRRAEALAEPVRPLPWAALLALPFIAGWLAAERLGLMEGRQLMAVALAEVLFLAVLGWRVYRALSAGLLYLFFLVPFGAFVTSTLQDWTAAFTGFGLWALGIPHEMDGFLIQIPEGSFYIAEACAGLRFLIASIAFGVLYAMLMYRGWGRRALFILASIAVPIAANWLRALGIVVAGHLVGSAQAAAADHVIYGWVFFSFVTLILILAGLPFRQDLAAPPQRRAPPPPPAVRLLKPAIVTIAIALLGTGAAAALDRNATPPAGMPGFAWIIPPGCNASPPQTGDAPGSSRVLVACPGATLTATVQVFSPRSTWSVIGAARSRLIAAGDAEDVVGGSVELPPGSGLVWATSMATGGPSGASLTASLLRIDGQAPKGGLAGRILLARHSLTGGSLRQVLLVVATRNPSPSPSPAQYQAMKGTMIYFLRAQAKLGAELHRLAAGG